jgi:hypothetical protein
VQALGEPVRLKGFLVESVHFSDLQGRPARSLNSGETYRIAIKGTATGPMKNASLGYKIRTQLGTEIYGASTADFGHTLDLDEGQRAEAVFELKCDLGGGSYYLTIATSEGNGRGEEATASDSTSMTNAVFFDVTGVRVFAGIVDLDSLLIPSDSAT